MSFSASALSAYTARQYQQLRDLDPNPNDLMKVLKIHTVRVGYVSPLAGTSNLGSEKLGDEDGRNGCCQDIAVVGGEGVRENHDVLVLL